MSKAFETVYKYKGRNVPLVICGLMMVLFIFLAAIVSHQGAKFGGIAFLLFAALFFLIIGGMVFISKADVAMDEESVSRTFLGKPFHTLQWKDVEKITVFPVYGYGGPNLIGYNIIAIRNRSPLSDTRKIYFDDKGIDSVGLVRCINAHIKNFNIRVERTSNGVTSVQKLI